jgi:phosphoribosylamine--glycine ligase
LIPVSAEDIEGIAKSAKELKIDLVVVGPEAPLVMGLKERLMQERILVFGPGQKAAELEGSKAWCKNFLWKYKIPTAWFEVFDDAVKAKRFIREKGAPIVVKADGLAAGKGVIVAGSIEDAENAVDEILVKKIFGHAGTKVVIEECLIGEEASFIGISDGENFLAMATSQDHKRVFDNDEGPNTGGMGAYSPAPVVDEQMFTKIMDTIMLPTIRGMKAEGREYRGALYAGLMITKSGPKVLEFNCRFGDPETQPLLFRLKSDLLPFLVASAKGSLKGMNLEWHPEPAVCVVLASGGYPGSYQKGFEITGIKEANQLDRTYVFHSGTAKKDGKLVTSGGRVLGVTARRENIPSAIDAVYEAVGKIHFEKMHYRRDIGKKALAHIS